MIGQVNSNTPVSAPAAARPAQTQVYGPVLPQPADTSYENDSAPRLKLEHGQPFGPPVDFKLDQMPGDPASNIAGAALSLKKNGLSTDAPFIAPGAKIGLNVSAKKMKIEEALLHNIPIDKRPRDYRAMVSLRIPLGGGQR